VVEDGAVQLMKAIEGHRDSGRRHAVHPPVRRRPV